MAKEDTIEIEGKVLEIIPGGNYSRRKIQSSIGKWTHCGSSRFW